MKKRKNKNNKKRNSLYSILDSNYFHICVEYRENKEAWRVYYKNLPKRVYWSKNNMPLLTSEENTVEDIYKLKEKFEQEKNKELKQYLSEYIAIDKEVFYQMLSVKKTCSTMLTDIQMLYLVASVINLFFMKNTEISLLILILTIPTALIGIYRINQMHKETHKGQKELKEIFVKEKIRRQGLYFVQKLKGE